MTEDLVALFLVIMLLVATVSMTTTGREYMANTKKKAPPELSPEESLEIVENSLKKAGPSGTYAAFNTQLSKYEDLISKDEKGDEE
jgi:hypothetical protein